MEFVSWYINTQSLKLNDLSAMSEWMANGSKWGSADLPFLVTTLNKGLVRSVQKSMNPQQVI